MCKIIQWIFLKFLNNNKKDYVIKKIGILLAIRNSYFLIVKIGNKIKNGIRF